MVYADLPDKISLAVLTDKFLSTNDEMKGVVVIVAQKGEIEVFVQKRAMEALLCICLGCHI